MAETRRWIRRREGDFDSAGNPFLYPWNPRLVDNPDLIECDEDGKPILNDPPPVTPTTVNPDDLPKPVDPADEAREYRAKYIRLAIAALPPQEEDPASYCMDGAPKVKAVERTLKSMAADMDNPFTDITEDERDEHWAVIQAERTAE